VIKQLYFSDANAIKRLFKGFCSTYLVMQVISFTGSTSDFIDSTPNLQERVTSDIKGESVEAISRA
jgi:prophage maintenance system killer protein